MTSSSPALQQVARRPGLVVAVLCSSGIVVALTQTMIVPLVPLLPTILHADAADASWAITATLLTASVATPIAGRLGDMFGKRRMLLIMLASLALGSVMCALSNSLIGMVAGRAVQGVAMGAIALGISILRDELPREQVGSGIAKVSATMGVGGAIGLPLAAFLTDRTDWHALFWVTGALAVAIFLAVLAVIPESPVRTAAPFDYLGAVGLSAALSMLLLAITKGGDWGWSAGITLGLLAGSLVVFLLWGTWELRRTAPLVDLRVSARPQVLFTNAASVAMGFAMYGMSLIPIQILMAPTAVDYGLGLSMTQAGLLLAPSGLLMFVFSGLGARISAIRGPRTSLATGAVVVGLGYLSALFLRDSAWELCLATCFIGAGIGIAYAAMPALIMGAVPISETAAANGLNSLMRSVGTSLSSALISVVLAQHVIPLGDAELPSRTGFTIVLWISIGATALALLLTLLIPRPGRSGVGARAAVQEGEPSRA